MVVLDINQLIEDFLREAIKSPHNDLSILDAIEDREQFLSALAARIASRPLLEKVKIIFKPDKDLPLAEIVASRFCDTLTDLLYSLRTEEGQEINLVTAYRNGHAEVDVSCPGKNIRHMVGESKWHSFLRRFGMGNLEMSMQGERMNLRSHEQG